MRVFRYDRKRNALIVQTVIMLIIAITMLYSYLHTQKIALLVLLTFALAFVGIYLYRILFMRIIFENDKVTFVGLTKKYTILKDQIYDIQLLKQVGREVNHVKYIKGGDYAKIASKAYVLIRKSPDTLQTNLSMFNAANENYISLEYVEGIEKYLDQLL